MKNRLCILLCACCLGLTGVLSACSPHSAPPLDEPVLVPVSIPYEESISTLALYSDIPGMIRLIGYHGGDFVAGTVEVSSGDWVPVIEEIDGSVVVKQTSDIGAYDSGNYTNLWKLSVGDTESFRFDIRNLRAEGHWNFSGLPVTALTAELGDAKNAFTCDEPNPAVMTHWDMRCGTGDVTVEGIVNAACRTMNIEAGSGTLTLRFGSRELPHDVGVTIQADSGPVVVSVPSYIPARFTVVGEPPVVTGEGYVRTDGYSYENSAYRESTAGFVIDVSISGGTGIIYLDAVP